MSQLSARSTFLWAGVVDGLGRGREGVSGGKSLRNLSGERVENNASAFLLPSPTS